MELVLNKRYKFRIDAFGLKSSLLGKHFRVEEIHEICTYIKVFNEDGSIFPGPGDVNYWVANVYNSWVWSDYIDMDYIELKPYMVVPKFSFC